MEEISLCEKTNLCPKCKKEVFKFFPVDYLDGSTLWECETCGLKFKTNDEGVVR